MPDTNLHATLCEAPNGTFGNAELLRQGYAQVMTIPPNVRGADQFVPRWKQVREES